VTPGAWPQGGLEARGRASNLLDEVAMLALHLDAALRAAAERLVALRQLDD